MTASRREFLQSSLAAFGTALLPWRLPATETPSTNDFDVSSEPQAWENFKIPRACCIGFEDKHGFCLIDSVEITFPKEAKFFKRFPCEIKIGRLVGPHNKASELVTTLGDISHKHNVYFAIPDEYGKKGVRIPQLGWLFKRPVITQVGLMVQTGKERFDAMAHEGGGMITVPESDRMMICENITLMCAYVPERAMIQYRDTYVLLPGSKDRLEIQREFEERYEKMTPAERKRYWDEVAQNANANRQMSAWDEAGIDVNDPSTYPEYQGGMDRFDPDNPYGRS